MFELSEVKTGVAWQQAMDYAEELGDGWRVPTKEELMIIYASSRRKEFATKEWFWSSSTYVGRPNGAWGVYFDNGDVDYYNKTCISDVRCVRGTFEQLVTWCFGKVIQ